jgi:sugar phosphate isomerase/epimerase
MLPVGLSSCNKPLSDSTFAAYREAGIEFMEISYTADFYQALDFDALREMADRNGVKLWSFHLPFGVEYNITSEEYGESTVAFHTELMKKGAKIGIKTFVVHPSAEPISDDERAAYLQRSKSALIKLADVAEELGVTLAVENLPRTCLGKNADEILDIVSVDPRLKICYDTNHLLVGDPVDFIRKIGSLIHTVHISDYDFINERHWMPGEGKLDWHAIYTELLNTGYRGPWLYEISFEAPKTITRPRNLTCSDFSKNAKEIFEGESLSVLGTPNPDRGLW